MILQVFFFFWFFFFTAFSIYLENVLPWPEPGRLCYPIDRIVVNVCKYFRDFISAADILFFYLKVDDFQCFDKRR